MQTVERFCKAGRWKDSGRNSVNWTVMKGWQVAGYISKEVMDERIDLQGGASV
jgi:hypothetical protein